MSKPLLLGMAIAFSSSLSIAQAPIIQPGAPGQPSRQITAVEASDLTSLRVTDADVKFMQGMIMHHAQALEMSALVETRSRQQDVKLLAERIALSQADEITMMEEWLQNNNKPLSDPEADHSNHDGNHSEMMPGMISAADLASLAAADGLAFDTLFLQLMIKHHQGAVTMVERLLAQAGSAQDSVMFEFTNEVTTEQNNEIERMTAMLAGFSPDPRVNLRAGFLDAGEASMNMELLFALSKPDGFFDPANPAGLPMSRMRELAAGDTAQASDEADEDDETAEPRPSLLNFANTDLAFAPNILIAGNYHGFNIYDISNPRSPQLQSSVVCPGGQGDVSVVGNLLIMSVEQNRGRLDCGLEGVAEPISTERFRGIRIFDVSDFSMPIQVGAVQTCRGSHTHTVISDPDDKENIYIYNSGTSIVRKGEELEGCLDESPYKDPGSARFRIEVIQIPIARPHEARIVSRPQVFTDADTGVIAGLWDGGDHGPGTQTTSQTNHCHDITAFPEIGLAAGACSGNGILFDISDPLNPVRLDQVLDPGFAYWHSATFNNDGSKVIFTDEWGGGSRARCRAFDPQTWGANAIYDIVDGKLQFGSYYKLSAPQSEQENCVAHNGSLMPVPGRDIFIQAWYQGGISVSDFTDTSNPIEIAYFDRGPIDEEKLILGGYWSAYWYEGLIYATEIARGLDAFALLPSDKLSANEIAAASLRSSATDFNPQQQRRHVWPAEPVVAKAYLDQLRRSGTIADGQDQALSAALNQVDDLLKSGSKGDADIMSALKVQAAALSQQSDDESGATQSRLLAMAATLQGLAERLQ